MTDEENKYWDKINKKETGIAVQPKNALLIPSFKVDSLSALGAMEQLEIKSEDGVGEVRNLGTPPLSSLVKNNKDKTEVFAFLKLSIVYLNQFIGTKWTDMQVKETAEIFYSKYYYWTFADLKLFFRKCKMMEYEKLLSPNQFAPFMLLQWASEYDFEWTKHSEQLSRLEHDSKTYDGNNAYRQYKAEEAAKELKKSDKETINQMRGTIQKLYEQNQNLKKEE